MMLMGKVKNMILVDKYFDVYYVMKKGILLFF